MTGASTEPFARDRSFWRLVAYALPIGLGAGLAALAFTFVVARATRLLWPDEIDFGFLGGEVWWIGVTAVAGLSVGLLRRGLRVPEAPVGALGQINQARVDVSTAPQTVLVSAVSLIGGASLGPFDAGLLSGGAIGEWVAARRGFSEDEREIATLSGIAGGIGGLLTAPVIATLFVVELARPRAPGYYKMLIPNLIASTAGFFIFFSIIGVTFLELFRLPGYVPEIWHFAVAIGLGGVAAALSILLTLTIRGLRAATQRLRGHSVALTTLGGVALGIIAVLFPLTIASGKDQLVDAVQQAEALGAALLVAVVFAKILAMAISLATGFIGGPVMPTLFIGGVAGLATHLIFPELPVALTFASLLVAVPGASVKAPFSMILLAALTVGIGPVATAPVGLAVLTAYLLTSGLGILEIPTPEAKGPRPQGGS